MFACAELVCAAEFFSASPTVHAPTGAAGGLSFSDFTPRTLIAPTSHSEAPQFGGTALCWNAVRTPSEGITWTHRAARWDLNEVYQHVLTLLSADFSLKTLKGFRKTPEIVWNCWKKFTWSRNTCDHTSSVTQHSYELAKYIYI